MGAQVQANGLSAAALAAAGNPTGLDPRLQNLAAAAAAGGIGVRPSFATGMAGIPHAATGLSLQAAIANQAAYGQALPNTCSRPNCSSTCRSLPWTKYRTGAWLWSCSL